MKIAVVHDWLVVYGGAEKVLEQILNIYPEADLFALVDFLDEDKRDFIKDKKVKTSFIQRLPKAKTKYRNYLPLMPLAIEQLDLSKYDLIISSSYCVAKGIITSPNQVHISYVHSPIRYAWDLQHQYLKEAGLTKGLKGWLPFLGRIVTNPSCSRRPRASLIGVRLAWTSSLSISSLSRALGAYSQLMILSLLIL